MVKKVMKELACPQCKTDLKLKNKKFVCEKGHDYESLDGIPLLFFKKGKDKQLGVKKMFNETPYGLIGAKDAYKNRKNMNMKVLHKDPWWIKEKSVKGKRVLEAGCGGGHLFTELYFNGAKVVGIDQTPNSLMAIKKLFKNESPELVNGNIEQLPFKDESFDLVTSMGVIHHTPGTQKALCELGRVMKKDGAMWIMVYHKTSLYYYLKHLMQFGARRSKLIGKLIYKSVPFFMGHTKTQANVETVYRDNIVNPITKAYTIGEMRKMAKNCGLKIVFHERHDLVELFWTGSFYKSKVLRPLEKRFGWFLTMRLEKA